MKIVREVCRGLMFLILAAVPGPRAATAATYTILHAFTGTDGALPGGLVADKAGNLYGYTRTTSGSSGCGCGTIFKLSPPSMAGGAWTETTLYTFTGGAEGTSPDGPLALGADSALYGEMGAGGNQACGQINGCGTVYRLAPPAAGQTGWTFHVIHVFGHLANGSGPSGGLVADPSGALFGTTQQGGIGQGNCNYGCGVIFRLSPPLSGTAWDFSKIYVFATGQSGSGNTPAGPIVEDAKGTLYGTTYTGAGGHGVIFQLSPPATGQAAWSYAELHSFQYPANGLPVASGLVVGNGGVVYGSTSGGGPNCYPNETQYQCGVVFSLTPPHVAGDTWAYRVIHAFGNSVNGAFPGTLAAYSGGKLYGSTSFGGDGSCVSEGETGCGVTFSLSPPAGGKTSWTYVITHNFMHPVNGALPGVTLVMGNNSNIFGTTFAGGDVMCGKGSPPGCGLVFLIR